VTRTFQVKVGLTDPPAAMRLGSTVVGRMKFEAVPVIEIPATALTEFDRKPAVWVVDPKSLTVSLRNVEVARNDPATIVISDGLASGEIVVTAGTQALHPGQKTRLLDSPQ
jgi:multidrug efflux pump subunit AcrA (membrane-fusion protein)